MNRREKIFLAGGPIIAIGGLGIMAHALCEATFEGTSTDTLSEIVAGLGVTCAGLMILVIALVSATEDKKR